jgi:hypothetical protein
MHRTKVIILLFLMPSLLFAQHNVKFTSGNFKGNSQGLKNAIQKIKEGDAHLAANEYNIALDCYLSADSLNHDNADLNIKIGICYLNSYCRPRCLRYFEKAISLEKSTGPRMPYFLARGYQLNYQWDSAVTEYQLYMHKANAVEKKEITKEMEECRNGKDLMQHPVYAKIENMGPNINSPYPDYSPFITADEKEIVFTSKRPNTTGGFIDPGSGEFFEDIYISYFKDGAWTESENLGAPINSGDNDATAYLSPDGQKLFLFRDINGGDIYVSNFGAQGWADPVALGKNVNSKYHESSVCLSPDSRTLYFVSDRPGGKGGRDIYKSLLQPDSSWGPAINMGDTINTPYDEEGVFIHPDGKTMYFSSKGHNSMGGYDIFRSVYDSGRWGVPQNLGYPINTPDDDVFFIVSASGKHGYFASAKDSGGIGGLDIYRVEMAAFKPRLIVLKGVILDSVSRKTLSASITLLNKTTGVSLPSNSNAGTGEYLLSLPSGNDYEIKVHSEGYPDYSFTMSIADTTTYREIVKNIALLIPGQSVAKTDTTKAVAAVNASGDTCRPDIAVLVRRFKGLTSDTSLLLNMFKNLDSGVCLKNMQFTVQIGAYHFPRNFKYKQVEIKPVKILGFSDGITRFTMGSFIDYVDAKEFKEEVVKRGVKDAFITGIYRGKRVLLEHLVHAKN